MDSAARHRDRILPDPRLRARLRRRLRVVRGKPPEEWFDVGDRMTVGRHTYGRPKVRWYYGDYARVSIGQFTSIAEDVVLMIGGNHPLHWVSTFPFRARFELDGAYVDGSPESNGDIVIGSDVYVGREARILSGVSIGDGAVIGAHAVVARDVRPYAVVVGNPAREVRRRFTDEQVERLLRLRWWDWPEERVLQAVPLLSSGDIEAFLDRYDVEASGGPGAPLTRSG